MKILKMKSGYATTVLYILLACLIAACSKSNDAPLPANPVNFTARVVDDHNIRLSWAAPADQAFKEYSLSYLPDGVPRSISKDSISVLVTKLIKGEMYAFSLKVRDINGNLSSGVSVQIKLEDTTTTVTDTGGATYNGDIVFSTQHDVDQFSKAYNRINGTVTISGADISDLRQLASIDSVKGLEIYYNDTLSNLAGLNKIRFIGGTLYIRGNKNLVHFNELARLEHVEKDLVILDNKKLNNIDGFSNLLTVNGSLYIGVEGWNNPPKPRGNQSLASFCGIKPLLSANGLKGDFFIQNNLSNPDKAEIISVCK